LSIEVTLLLQSKKSEEIKQISSVQQHVQQQTTQPPLSLLGVEMEDMAELEQVILGEFWQVFENLVKYVMDILWLLYRKQGTLEEQTHQVGHHQ
jgi:hypothetical protein